VKSGLINCSLEDLPFLVPIGGMIYDGMGSYQMGAVNGLDRGRRWRGPYNDKNQPFGIYFMDTMGFYANGAALNGLNAFSWFSPYVDKNFSYLRLLANDSMAGYPAGRIAGLNSGSGFLGPYIEPLDFPLTFTPDTNLLPITVTMSIAQPPFNPPTTIYYTTDGTYPTVNSPVYTAPVVLAQSTYLQAIALAPGYASVQAQLYPVRVPFTSVQFLYLSRNNLSARAGMHIRMAGNNRMIWQLGRLIIGTSAYFGTTQNSQLHTLYIVDASNPTADLASVVIDASQGIPGSFLYGTLNPPAFLAASHDYYILSSEVSGLDYFWNDNSQLAFTGAAAVVSSIMGEPGAYSVGTNGSYCFGPLDFIYS